MSVALLCSAHELFADEKAENPIVETQEEISQELETFNSKLDRFFGGTGRRSADYDSHIILGMLSGYETRGGLILRPDMSLRLTLPGTKRRFSLLFRSSESSPRTRQGNYLGRDKRETTRSFDVGTKGLGLEFKLYEHKNTRLVIQEYLRLHLREWPEPVTRLLVIGEHQLSDRLIFDYQTGPRWDPDNGFSLMLEPSLTLFPTKNFSVDFSSDIYWGHQDGFDKAESVTMTSPIDSRSALFVRHAFEYHIRPYRSGDFVYSLGYRRQIFFKWLVWQVNPALIFDGEKDWMHVYRIATGLQVSFGSKYSDITDFIAI